MNIMAATLRKQKIDLSKLEYKGRKMDLVESEGIPWVRPQCLQCFWVDKTNVHEPENSGW